MRTLRPLTGYRLKAPCWWCSKAMYGGYGQTMYVDGNEVAVHTSCKELATTDDLFHGRIEADKLV